MKIHEIKFNSELILKTEPNDFFAHHDIMTEAIIIMTERNSLLMIKLELLSGIERYERSINDIMNVAIGQNETDLDK